MEILNKIKPVYLYLISGLLLLIAKAFEKENQLLFYLFLSLGLLFFFMALIRYFRTWEGIITAVPRPHGAPCCLSTTQHPLPPSSTHPARAAEGVFKKCSSPVQTTGKQTCPLGRFSDNRRKNNPVTEHYPFIFGRDWPKCTPLQTICSIPGSNRFAILGL